MYSERLACESKSRRCMYMAGRVCMAINPIFVCHGQSVCDDNSLCSNSISSCFDTKNSIYSVVITMCLILECSCHNVPCFGAVTSPVRAQVTSCLALCAPSGAYCSIAGCPLFRLKNTCKERLCSSTQVHTPGQGRVSHCLWGEGISPVLAGSQVYHQLQPQAASTHLWWSIANTWLWCLLACNVGQRHSALMTTPSHTSQEYRMAMPTCSVGYHTLWSPTEIPKPGETVFLLETLHSSPITATQIKTWTVPDPVLSAVKEWMLSGWSDTSEDHERFLPYHRRREELSLKDGCVKWGSRVAIWWSWEVRCGGQGLTQT